MVEALIDAAFVVSLAFATYFAYLISAVVATKYRKGSRVPPFPIR